MEEIASQKDIEKLINERHIRHNRLMKDLDSVMEVLLTFCNQAEWMMDHDYRIGELIGEVIVASTEVEHILPRTNQYFEEYQRMLLPAIDRQKPKNFDKALGRIKGVLPRLKPYCDNIKEDEEALKMFRNGEVELTYKFNDKYIAHYEIAIENLTAAVYTMERHIVESQKKHDSITDDIIKMQFDTMFRQYSCDKYEEITEYIGDIGGYENLGAAKNELIASHQSSDLFSHFRLHENRPDLLIRALKLESKIESCLLTIFYLKARMDVLKQLKNAAIKRKDEQSDKDQPINTVFIKNYDGKPLDFFTIRKVIEIKLVRDIKYQYEWYAAYRILDDLKLLEELKLTSFAEQMNKWYPDAKVPCDADAFGDYATGHTGMNFSRWDEEKFLAEKKKNQTKKGFRKLWNLCHDIKDALKTIPTLQPRQQ